MGRKQVSRVFKVVDSGDMSAAITSAETVVEQFDIVSYFINWSGTGVSGSFVIEVSNDEEEYNKTWKELDFNTTISISTDSGKDQILIKDVHFKRIRIRYVFTAGTGSMDVEIKSTTKGA